MRILAVAVWALLALPAVAEAKVKQGDRAADFTVKDKDGKEVKLSDFKGKVVVLDFWASWCEPCRKELPALDKLAASYAGNDKVVFLAVNYDTSRSNAEKVLNAVKIGTMKLLFDPQKASVATYDPGPPLPGSYVISANGIVKLAHNGFDESEGTTPIAKTLEALLK